LPSPLGAPHQATRDRYFILRNLRAKDTTSTLHRPRWVSYLRGPLTPAEVRLGVIAWTGPLPPTHDVT
jgi:hypothetical protein